MTFISAITLKLPNGRYTETTMPHPKYNSSLQTLWGFGASRITRADLSSIREVFNSFQINESNSSWHCDREALRVEVLSTRARNQCYVFDFIKLCRRRLFISRQCLWLLGAEGGWTTIRYKWLQWQNDVAYTLRPIFENGSGLPYSSAGDAISAVKDHSWGYF